MASPQIENGHTRLANELLQAIYRFGFTGAQLRLILWVARISYGWQRKWTAAATMSQISEETTIPKASVGWAISTLLKVGVIVRDDAHRYSLNKNFDAWMAQSGDRLPSNGLDGKDTNSSNPLDDSSNPLDKIVQPIGRSYKELKKVKKGVKKGAPHPTIPPTLEEVIAYCKERNRGVIPSKWYDHYTANGWRVGRTRMVDWKAAVRTWEHNYFSSQPVTKGAAAVQPGKYAR